jgi:hypothetical protein
MVEVRGFRADDDDDDSEITPLTIVPTYKTYEEKYEDLPPYSEAIKGRGHGVSQETEGLSARVTQPLHEGTSPGIGAASNQENLSHSRRLKFILLTCALIPGIALIIVGIYWYNCFVNSRIQWSILSQQYLATNATDSHFSGPNQFNADRLYRAYHPWDAAFVSSSFLLDLGFVAASVLFDRLPRRESTLAQDETTWNAKGEGEEGL